MGYSLSFIVVDFLKCGCGVLSYASSVPLNAKYYDCKIPDYGL